MAKRIVIIEDDPNILDLLTYLFKADGYDVSAFATGMSAAEIGTLKPDVVLLDVALVGYPKTGDQICSELKALLSTSRIPVLLLSAERNLQAIANACHSDAFLCKPFDIDELLDKVHILAA
jgi:two-component system response regulator VicR